MSDVEENDLDVTPVRDNGFNGRFRMFADLSEHGRNHVFKVGGPLPWSRVLLPFYRKILDRSTEFGAVGYIITLYLSRSY